MDISVQLDIPEYIFRFYQNASACVAGSSPEKLMADALSGYAGMLSKEIAQERSKRSTEDI